MEIGSLSANRNLIIGFLCFVVLALAFAYGKFYYMPTQVKIQDLEKIVEKKERDVREIEMTRRLLSEKKQEIERLKVDIARLERFFPEEVFIPRVLVLIENLANATHLKVGSIKPAKGAKRSKSSAKSGVAKPTASSAKAKTPTSFDSKKEYKTSAIDFKAKGTFQNLYNFMNELTTFPKLVVVDNLKLVPENDNNEESSTDYGNEVEVGSYVDLAIDMPLTFYIQRQKQPEF